MTLNLVRVGHLLAHTGGGVGAFLASALRTNRFGFETEHHVIQLLEPRDFRCVSEIAQLSRVSLVTAPDASQIKPLVESLDVLVVHWWHHPALYEALWALEGLPTRLVLWCHVNGLHAPRIPNSVLEAASLVVTSSRTSHRNLLLRDDVSAAVASKTLSMYSLAHLETHLALHRSRRSGAVAYAGTIDFSKMSPDFVDLLPSRSDLPEVSFFGQPTCEEQLVHRTSTRLGPKLKFLGHSENLASALDLYGVFLYPLAREHYGTTENVLQEAMALGLVPLVLPNETEVEILGSLADQLAFPDRDGLKRILAELADPGIREFFATEARSIVEDRWMHWIGSSDLAEAIDYVCSLPRQPLEFATTSGERELRNEWLEELLHIGCPEAYCLAVTSLHRGILTEEEGALISASTWRLWTT